ncbi:hypothetical protein R6Q59_005821 [Mikania micrantha]
MEDDTHKTPSSSFRDRRRKPTLNISCFRNRHLDSHLHSPTPSPPIKKSPSTFLRSILKINDLATLLDYKPGDGTGNHRRHQITGGTTIRRHRQRSSSEFAYDPLSYSLNFEEQGLHIPNFISRLPVSPIGCNKLDDSTRLDVDIARTDRDV